MMLTIAWNLPRFHVVDALPKRQTFNATYHIEYILQLFFEFCLESGRYHFVIHASNARSHTSQNLQTFCNSNFLRIVPYPPYSPDLAPPYFSIQLCEELSEEIFICFRRSTSSRIHTILRRISVVILKAIFRK
jgi:hypothetical protein